MEAPNYEKIKKLGKGTYGTVYKIKNYKDGKVYALKKIKIQNEKEGIPSTALREISTLKELSHPNIVRLVNVYFCKTSVKLFFEYLKMDLKQLIDSTKSLDMIRVKQISKEILLGVDQCHSKRILHRDLKPQNILLNSRLDVKVADFGLARAFTIPIRPYTNDVVTLWYRAPEILLGAVEYSTAIDIWSVGCIISEMISGEALFRGDSDLDQLYKIFRILGTPTEEIWPGVSNMKNYKNSFPNWISMGPENILGEERKGEKQALDLILKMLKYNPVERITCKEALAHPFFNNI